MTGVQTCALPICLIYTDSEFLRRTRDAVSYLLMSKGVDEDTAQEVANDIEYSEQGMQDEGRVSFDAYALADYLRKHYAN